jgi:DNA-directed RNA polymerase II subunit RPB2
MYSMHKKNQINAIRLCGQLSGQLSSALEDADQLHIQTPAPSLSTSNRMESEIPSDKDSWRAIQDYLDKYGLVRHQIESFDVFICNTLHNIVSENSDVTSVSADGDFSWHLQFVNVVVHKPTSRESEGFEKPLYPHAARMRGLTYSSSVCVDVVHDKIDHRCRDAPTIVWRKVYRSVVLCRLPMMVRSCACYLRNSEVSSNECAHDRGGYFIINGHEKALLCQEKLRVNMPFVFSGKSTKFDLICEVRSCSELKLRSTSTLYMCTIKPSAGGLPSIVVRLPFLMIPIPLPILFQVLGATTCEDAMQYVLCDVPAMEHIFRNMYDMAPVSCTQQAAFEWIGKEATKEVTKEKRNRYTTHIIGNELLPHVGLRMDPLSNRRKMNYLGYMVRRLLRVHLGMDPLDDRDDYSNKRIDSAGTLMALLMRQLYRSHLKGISVAQNRLMESGKIDRVAFGELMCDKRVTSGFKYAFATGNWNAHKSGLTNQNGTAQVMSRMSTFSTQSNLRRINTPISREGKCIRPRQLHATAYGIICPAESPEGTGCGLVKNLSLLTHIRTGALSTPIAEMILHNDFAKVTPILLASTLQRAASTLVIVNGIVIGFVYSDAAQGLVERLRCLRRSHTLPFDTSIVLDSAVHISSDPGGMCRPLVIADRARDFSKLVQQTAACHNCWETLLCEGVIEYIDKQEEATLRVATRFADLLDENGHEYTHVGLDPTLNLGIMASIIPFSSHNQSPRNTYQAAMGKQAVGWYCSNWPRRTDAVAHVQCYPQRQLVTTKVEHALRAEQMPSGANAMIIICAYGGFNQEDSILCNRSSVERGMFRSLIQRTVKDEEKNGADAERFEVPTTVPDCAGLRVGKYDKLDPTTGIVPPGTTLQLGDCMIGKTINTSDVAEVGMSRGAVKRDKSQMVKHTETSVVDMVLHTRTRDGAKAVRIRTHSMRTPVVGDKFCVTAGDHEVLCQRGWVPIEGVTTDDYALTLCPHNDTMGYERVVETHAYECQNETLLDVDTEQLSLKVTMGHRMYTKRPDADAFELVHARDAVGTTMVYKTHCCSGLRIPVGGVGFVSPPIPIPDDAIGIVDVWLSFFGFWIGRGCCHEPTRRVIISCFESECEYLMTLSRMLEIDVVGDSNLQCGRRCVTYCGVANPDLYDFLLPSSIAEQDRCLPAWSKQLPKQQSKQLLAGILATSFGLEDDAHFTHTIASRCLCDDLQMLALHAGCSLCVAPHGDDESVLANVRTWTISVHAHDDDPARSTEEQQRVPTARHNRLVEFTGWVHCITVRTGIFYIRRRGKGCWTGNSSRHGQKGVIGNLIDEAEMPYCPHTGMRCDLIINPHAIPSRMTIGMLVEELMCILALDEGKIGDGTPYRKEITPDTIGDELERRGLQRHGNRMMVHGQTGEPLSTLVFYAPAFYQRLKHMVVDKVHARARGPVQILTRQPLEGRSHMGGLRFGEMERDTLIAHGASYVLLEFLLLKSDAFSAVLCADCGLLALPAAIGAHVRNSSATCRACGSSNIISKSIPYAKKLLLQELYGMHIAARVNIEKRENANAIEDKDEESLKISSPCAS